MVFWFSYRAFLTVCFQIVYNRSAHEMPNSDNLKVLLSLCAEDVMSSLGYFGADKPKWPRAGDYMTSFPGPLLILLLGGRKGEDPENEVGDLSWRPSITHELVLKISSRTGFVTFVSCHNNDIDLATVHR